MLAAKNRRERLRQLREDVTDVAEVLVRLVDRLVRFREYLLRRAPSLRTRGAVALTHGRRVTGAANFSKHAGQM